MNFMLIFTKQFPKLFIFFNGTVTEIQNWLMCQCAAVVEEPWGSHHMLLGESSSSSQLDMYLVIHVYIVLKMWILLSYSFGEANRSGDNYHSKDSLFLIVLKRRGACHTMKGHTGKHKGWSGAKRARGKCEQELLLWFLQEMQDMAG